MQGEVLFVLLFYAVIRDFMAICDSFTANLASGVLFHFGQFDLNLLVLSLVGIPTLLLLQ